MSVLTGVGILLLSMLIVVFLQLSPSIFLIFSHYASAKYSRYKASDLTLFYIIGVETITALIFVVLYFIIMATNTIMFDLSIDLRMVTLIMAGICLAIGIIIPFIYYRKGPGTKLFVSRKLAYSLSCQARNTKTRSEAFILGLISSIPEFIFTLPIYLISITIIMNIGETFIIRSAIILLFMIASILPLFIIKIGFSNGLNLAILQKIREKNKIFVRVMLGLLYILISVVLILGVYN